jgi:two-component system OmpR family sensor kinase
LLTRKSHGVNHEVCRVLAELRQANVALEKSNRVKSDLLGVMSHEFKTPLNLIVGYAGMVKERCLGAISEEQQKALERILTLSLRSFSSWTAQ